MWINKMTAPTGYFTEDTPIHHTDDGLMAALASFLPAGAYVLDVGCGDGAYTRALRKAGIDCYGYDGNPNTPAITGGLCKIADFARPLVLGLYDWVLCLEVGEHIPAEYESALLDNLDRHAKKGIILSWAVPGQGGREHVNERSNAYIKEQLAGLGFTNDLEAESLLRSAVTDR